MKKSKLITAVALMGCLVGLSFAEQPAGDKTDVKPYPLAKCLVTGEKLGEMGKPHIIVHEGREIKFCCKGCVKEFNKDTAAFIKKLEQAEKLAAKENPYPFETCIVSGKKLGGDMGKPFAFVYADREIKLCCKGCLKEFLKNDEKYLEKLCQAGQKSCAKGCCSADK